MHRRRIIGDDDSDHDAGATLCDAAAEPRQLGPCRRRATDSCGLRVRVVCWRHSGEVLSW